MGSLSWKIATTILGITELLLLVIGTAAPLWVWLDDGDDHVGVGLFNRVGWDPDGINQTPDGFTKVKFTDEDTIDEDHWIAMAALFVTSCVLAALTLTLLVVYFFKSQGNQKVTIWHSILVVCSVLTWLCCFAGLIIFLAHHGDAVTTSRQIDDVSFSWSFLLCLLGGALGVLVTFLIATKVKKQQLNAIPAALDSKIGMYPATKTGFDNQVFQGMPYSSTILPTSDGKEESQFSQPQTNTPPENNINDRRQLIQARNGEFESPQGFGIYSYNINNNVNGNMNRVHRELSKRLERETSPRDELVLYRGQDNQRTKTTAPRLTGNPLREHRGNDNLVFSPDSKLNKRVVGATSPFGRRRTHDNVSERLELEEEVIFNSDLDRGLNPRPGIDRGDFLVTARHGQDRDVHRDVKTYLSHTTKPVSNEDNVQGQRLVLSPANFTDSNVKYNPSMTYKPFSSQVY